jgi:Xaa-Pro aminopeptidase
MQRIGPRAAAIVCAAPESKNGGLHHRFRQAPDFYYLTGATEPDWVLVLRPGDAVRSTLFIRARDPRLEIYDGPRPDTVAARTAFQVDACYFLSELDARLTELVANVDDLHYQVGVAPEFDERVLKLIASMRGRERYGFAPPLRLVDLRETVHDMRLRKEPEELARHRQASAITAEAHLAAQRAVRPGMFEYELEALVDWEFRRRGARGPGYQTTVASGDNATILHYKKNDAKIADGALVLLDAGCDFDHYNADVTRTFPANGRFSPEHKRAYERVLAVQVAAVAMVKAGVSVEDIHAFCVRGLTEAMIDLGILSGSVDERVRDSSFKKFYPHHTCHYLGMDVHDVGAYRSRGQYRPLEPGMIITVEPGLYVPASATEVPASLRGFGIRIEDDVLVTETGQEVLSAAVPKSVADLEKTVGK